MAARGRPRKDAPKILPDKTETTEKQIGSKKLIALLREVTSTTADMQELSGSLNERIGHAVEHDHLHKKAFSTLRVMDRMTPEKLADYWDTLQFYVDASGLGERAASAPAFNLSGRKDEEEETELEADEAEQQKAAEKDPGNVKAFPRPIGAPV
jgi:Ran GTPase-activating protein (RanGAP) involved in mRNA processing and transport